MTRVFSDIEQDEIRRDFPHTEQGHIYLNHAAISPLSMRVKRAIETYVLERHLSPIENFEKGQNLIKEAREAIAACIHAPSPDTITFMTNTSEGISAVAEGFEWQKGDQIILNRMEFPANIHPFRVLERKGVEMIYLDPENGQITTDLIETAITPKTKMLSISAVQYLNGFRADLISIGKVCRSHNIFFIVDGIQSLGAFPVDVDQAQVDALSAGGHKWLMGPMGLGFLYLSKRLSEKMTPSKTGWLSVEDPWNLANFNQKWKPVSLHLETGTPNVLGIIGLGASLKRFIELKPERVRSGIQQLCNHLIGILSEKSSCHLLTPEKEELRAGIVTFSTDNHPEPEKAVKRLKEKNITVSAREGYFRFSPHYYNTKEEIDRAVHALFQESP